MSTKIGKKEEDPGEDISEICLLALSQTNENVV